MKLQDVKVKEIEGSVKQHIGTVPTHFVGRSLHLNERGVMSLYGSPTIVDLDFSLNGNNLRTLIYGPKEVKGYYSVSENRLTTLRGAPKEVGITFRCSENNLRTLKYGPAWVGNDYDCQDNELESLDGVAAYIGGSLIARNNRITSLKGIHTKIHSMGGMFDVGGSPLTSHILGVIMIPGVTIFRCDDFQVERIVNKYLRQGMSGVLKAQEELEDNNREPFAKL